MESVVNEVSKQFGKLVNLSPNTISAISEALLRKSISKGEYFVNEGQVCRYVGVLVKGIARVYYIHKGKAFTSYFNTEERNPFLCAFASFLQQSTSREAVQALEDCQLLVLSHKALYQLYHDHPDFERFGRLMAEQNYIWAMERIHDLQNLDAYENYQKFLELYPGLINRIPHHYVASYLGVTPESLSRIRKRP